jgi:molybdopterin biosynthesis enzyme MoaB
MFITSYHYYRARAIMRRDIPGVIEIIRSITLHSVEKSLAVRADMR